MTTDEPLKPCPLCGSCDLQSETGPGIQNGPTRIYCNQCDAGAPIKSWQGRAELASSVPADDEDLKALEAAVSFRLPLSHLTLDRLLARLAHPPAPAVLDVDLARKGFWRGFEMARCVPGCHDIQAAWADARPNLLSGHARLSKPPAPVAPDLFGLKVVVDSTMPPDGWKLVPELATTQMKNAGWQEIERQGIDPESCEMQTIYHALIAAAPAAPGGGVMGSPTSGMTIGERIAHVGGRTKEDHCIEFGSVLAVSLLMEHVARDLVDDQPVHSAAPIQQRIAEAEQKHGGLRSAARALGIDPAYLFRLKNSQKMNPSDEVLSALRLERVTFYRNKARAETT